MNWLKDTTQAYRRGYVEGEAGEQDAYLLYAGSDDEAEYRRGFADGMKAFLDDQGGADCGGEV